LRIDFTNTGLERKSSPIASVTLFFFFIAATHSVTPCTGRESAHAAVRGKLYPTSPRSHRQIAHITAPQRHVQLSFRLKRRKVNL
uniref:Secreted protein n=1 Tax=Salarias fasciatus TaxID=181472 RepID=A0A672GR72_SALFA